jgi:hypothetical protein
LVVLRRDSLRSCGGPNTGHSAVMVYSDGQEANTAIAIVRNDSTQSHRGIRIFNMNTGITVDGNRVTGASVAVYISTPGVAFTPYTKGPVGFALP